MNSAAVNTQFEANAPDVRLSIWREHLKLLVIASAIILALLWRDAWDMMATWWDISTYNHCLLIVPILYWLVQQRSDELKKIAPQIWTPGLLWVGIASIGWLLGEAAGVSFARQLGLIMMLQGAAITLLGPKVSRGLVFPLFYSFFLVPFGEELVPFLQTITAKMSMVFLDWAAIPAFIDGVFISTPTGYFEVAEACSGVKFLIAMIAYGALVSNVCFQSWKRRLLFMLAAMVMPILANGIRAFGTIYIAHHTSTDFASGFDHIFYGWFFFAFVLVLVMAIGWPFFDRKIDEKMIEGEAINALEFRKSKLTPKYAIVVLLAIVTTPFLWTSILASQSSQVPENIALPEVAGWEIVSYDPAFSWKPRFDGANHSLLGRYRNASTGQNVDLAISVFDQQEDGREIVGYGQGAFDPESDWSWSRDLPAPVGATALQITAPGPVTRDVLSFYRIGNKLTGSGTAVKLETLKMKLLGGNQQAVAVLVSAEKTDDRDQRQAIDQFLSDLGPIDKLADEMAGLR
ncbi:exosortase A [Parasphingorhabdus halotolerans]|uniref:Exosortase A n=1 Tax=Parasphingorhabdus halotolerans TaxID=2725558 RepID=A0A6H2DJ74_9SPHN|nr:exosortase A [Parasphingorhabdus halotolerans]QJB68440.1 exosortase A [Parasphingorhabdus halotolerans]